MNFPSQKPSALVCRTEKDEFLTLSTMGNSTTLGVAIIIIYHSPMFCQNEITFYGSFSLVSVCVVFMFSRL
jgi:hypothetical protein